MCVYSMIVDHYTDKWRPLVQETQPYVVGPYVGPITITPSQPSISEEEVAEFRKLLERAREYDRKMNQPDCEMEDKKRVLRELAEKLGVDLSFPGEEGS